MDLYILLLPIATVWSLQMPLQEKLEVISVMTFGVCSVAIACVRIPIILSLFSSPDTSLQLGKMVIIAAAEIQAAIVAVNLPCIKSFWSRFMTRNMGGSEGGTPGARVYHRVPFLSGRFGKGGNKANGQGLPLGTITRLERDIQSTGSEERLWERAQGDCEPVGSPGSVKGSTHNKNLSRDGIMVTHTKVDVSKDEC